MFVPVTRATLIVLRYFAFHVLSLSCSDYGVNSQCRCLTMERLISVCPMFDTVVSDLRGLFVKFQEVGSEFCEGHLSQLMHLIQLIKRKVSIFCIMVLRPALYINHNSVP